jgi:2-polyprenyl-6-methoxyphenol hydroxylase-like FAD-dependent oxidoreductase
VNQEAGSADEILISGGGIGGLATALALKRTGRNVRVLERAPEFGEVGAGVQLAPNATRLLRSWGLLDEVLATSICPRRLVLSDAATGSELTSMELGEPFLQRFGAPYVVLHRSDLLQILLDACRAAGVALENDRAVIAAESTDEGVIVDVAGGRQYRGALLVGADGLHSVLRKYLAHDVPIASGFVAYRGALPIDQARGRAHPQEVQLYMGPGIHLVQYPVRSGQMYNQVAVFRSAQFLAGVEDWGTPEELHEMFADTCPAVRDSVASLSRDQRWPMYDRAPIDSWVSGRLVLLGDAAHPMLQYLAQGACQALEDAASLADALQRLAPTLPHDGDEIAKALAEYERVRIPRTARVQQNARIWGDIWHTDGVAALLRNELFARRTSTEFREAEWLFGDMSSLGGSYDDVSVEPE